MISKEKELKKAVDEAVKILREGGVILYPTDTVWGLGCDATNPKAVEKIAAKRVADLVLEIAAVL